MQSRFINYWNLCRLDKPVGILLLLWPTLWGLWFAARGIPPFKILILFNLGVVLMRSAGCVINDVLDKDFDPFVERTKDRPIAAGRVSRREGVFVFLVLLFFALMVAMQLNAQSLWFAVPAAILAASYPLMKRYIAIPQAYLGLAFSWGIPMAYAAVQGQVIWSEAIPLMLANVCWVIAYDTYYAMVDKEDDLKIGVKSAAIFFGKYDLTAIGLLHVLCFILLMLAGRELSWPYFAGLVAAKIWAYWLFSKATSRAGIDCFTAFKQSHWIGCAVFLGLFFAHWPSA